MTTSSNSSPRSARSSTATTTDAGHSSGPRPPTTSSPAQPVNQLQTRDTSRARDRPAPRGPWCRPRARRASRAGLAHEVGGDAAELDAGVLDRPLQPQRLALRTEGVRVLVLVDMKLQFVHAYTDPRTLPPNLTR